MTAKFDKEEITSHIVKILEDHLGETFSGKIAGDTSLESIEIDSIDMVEVVFNIEDKYDINVPLDDVSDAKTVGDISDKLIDLLKSSSKT